MKVRHVDTIVFVRDLASSVGFYRDVLGQVVKDDWGAMVRFEGGLSLHDGSDLFAKVYKRDRPAPGEPLGRDNLEIYFEADDLEAAFRAVAASAAEVIHPIEVQPWGQRVFRFHDPDGHIVEIGEPQ